MKKQQALFLFLIWIALVIGVIYWKTSQEETFNPIIEHSEIPSK